MSVSGLLKQEMLKHPEGEFAPMFFRAFGYERSTHSENARQRADGLYALFTGPEPYIYKNDRIVGSIRPYFVQVDEKERARMEKWSQKYPERRFITNADHYASDYRTILACGLPGLFEKIEASKKEHRNEAEKCMFLAAMETALLGFKGRILKYADQCEKLVGEDGYDPENLAFIEANLRAIAERAPETFAEALQLIWMIHTAYLAEDRYAMALGRIDQYLYPFYRHDIEKGTLSPEEATVLLENVFMKIYERAAYRNSDDVVNICIGGCAPDGSCEVNELSHLVLNAVRGCKIAGPNLSARITPNTPDDFLDHCLQVIGTGIGYPALMNDSINLEALRRYGYREEDLYDYCMVGCIENFITGKQPPWSDGRFDTPRFFEYVLNNGLSYDGSTRGLDTGDVSEIHTMDDFMERFERQLTAGVQAYVDQFNRSNIVRDPENHTSPFLSCFCEDCIGRGLDINMGGSLYPSVHGAALMGVGTTADSLASIEKNVFIDRSFTLAELRDALKANFEGYEELHKKLLDAPKYGNNLDFADKYAVWFVDYLGAAFRNYRTYDGGGIYIAMAANVNNIDAGTKIGATPDGRRAKEPLSDAASPTYGRDTEGPTSTVLSITKPSYEQVACGSVINQKFSPSAFKDGNREKLLHLLRVYFRRGGQEMQINATSPEILQDAMRHPENYQDLVVRVSGFSALFVGLNIAVQKDILSRTQQY